MWRHPSSPTVTGRSLALASLIAGALMLAPGAAAGDAWLAEGRAIAPWDHTQSDAVLAADSHGGAFVAWQDYRTGGISIFIQHVLADGSVASGWPASGMALPNGGASDPVILADRAGGVFVAAADGSAIHLWHVAAGGTLTSQGFATAPPSASSSGPLEPTKVTPTTLPELCPDGAGGAFLAWERGGFLSTGILVLHLLPNGSPDPAWPAGGALAATMVSNDQAPVLCGDGDSGVYVGFLEPAVAGEVLHAQHLDAHGALAAGWPARGLAVSDAAGGQDAPAIVADGAGGALLLWEDARGPVHAQLFAQRVTAGASIAPGWPAAGRVVCSTPVIAGEGRYGGRGLQLYTSAVSDGAGGVIVAWQDARADSGDVYAQHLLPDGSLAAGWPVDGLALSAAPGTQQLPSLAADGAGGAFAAWQEDGVLGSANVRAQHVSGSGVIAPGWAGGGVALTATRAQQFLPRVAADGAGGALIAWQDADCGAMEILASRVAADGSVPGAHGPASVSASALASSADSGSIHVSWQLSSSGALPALAVVYCREVDGPWNAVGTVAADAAGRVLYADRGAIAGCRYGYALGVASCGREQMLGETWVSVPYGSGFLALALTTASVQADSGRVRLTWRLTGGQHLPATVSWRDSCSDWHRLGDATVDDSDRVEIVDTSPEYVGARRQYRLVVHACGIEHDLGRWWTEPFAGPGTVPVYASLISAAADSGVAVLEWRLAFITPGLSTLVERREPGADWTARGAAAQGGNVALQFRDTGLLPTRRYEYRLNLFVCDARTTLPAFAVVAGGMPAPRAQLALTALGPNPAGGALTLALSVPYGEPVRLELLDASGRSVLDRRLDPTGTEQSVVLDGLGALRPGFYMLRVTQRGVSRSRRVVILR